MPIPASGVWGIRVEAPGRGLGAPATTGGARREVAGAPGVASGARANPGGVSAGITRMRAGDVWAGWVLGLQRGWRLWLSSSRLARARRRWIRPDRGRGRRRTTPPTVGDTAHLCNQQRGPVEIFPPTNAGPSVGGESVRSRRLAILSARLTST